jgi:predicted RecB family nuclease
MERINERLIVSPTDLVAFLDCGHLTALDLAAAAGECAAPTFDDPAVAVVRARGLEHERTHLAAFKARGGLVQIADPDFGMERLEALRMRERETAAAMREGIACIYQATFLDETDAPAWRGHADFLTRVDAPSALGDFRYEPEDTKLARHVKPSAVLQLCEYARQVERLQGAPPDRVHVVLGDGSRVSVTLTEVAAYHRAGRARFIARLGSDASTYPLPVAHCAMCEWDEMCRARREADDHLCRVANLRQEQASKLVKAGVATLTELAAVDDDAVVAGISTATLGRLRQQARLQAAAMPESSPPFELVRPFTVDRGLCLLPAPDPGDLFYDIEGDPFVAPGGLEYLHGLGLAGPDGFEFRAFWAHDADEERTAFEAVVDFIVERRAQRPAMHVYHYAPYERTALGRIMGRHGTREDEIDDLLRGDVFVDLYRVVRQGVLVGSPSYSLKRIESLYRPSRAGAVTDAASSIVEYERWLATGEQNVLDGIEAYNREDVESTWQLREWLEAQRAEAVHAGVEIARPTPKVAPAPEEVPDDETEMLIEQLRASESCPDDEVAARLLLADLLRWHQREDRPVWWRYFDVILRTDEAELLNDTEAVAGLELVGDPVADKQSLVWTYSFDPDQEHKLRANTAVCDPAVERAKYYGVDPSPKPPGTLVAVDSVSGTLKLRRSKNSTALHPRALFPHDVRRTPEHRSSLRRVAQALLDHGIDGPGPALAARRLLARRAPLVDNGTSLRRPGEDAVEAAVRIVSALDGACVPIQGPPGAGKTYTAARVVCALVREGRAVGIVANSHAVIGNLLRCVVEEASTQGVAVRVMQKVSGTDQGLAHQSVKLVTENSDVEEALAAGQVDVVAGTSWLFARASMASTIDTLVVDEAGQLSLANVVAVAPAARNVVLVGDPQQLAQPSKGVHPDGAGVSALDHLLDGASTVPDHLGLFLDRTWRLHPDICAFVSEQVYDGRLETAPDRDRQRITDGPLVGGAGLRWLPVAHDGNRTSSEEEAIAVRTVFEALVGREWVGHNGTKGTLGVNDILVVAPYNAQVHLVGEQLPQGARVGTVDRFQGQEAAVVIVSLAASSAEDVPRGMEFLYSRNRLNVAVSRAQALAVVVASPALLAARCRSLEQMRLVNVLCRYVELADEVTLL